MNTPQIFDSIATRLVLGLCVLLIAPVAEAGSITVVQGEEPLPQIPCMPPAKIWILSNPHVLKIDVDEDCIPPVDQDSPAIGLLIA